MTREAAVAWSAIAEPADAVACGLVRVLGAERALTWVRAAVDDPVSASAELGVPEPEAARVVAATARWSPRLASVNAHELLERAERLGAWVLTPGEPGWPRAFSDLGDEGEPFALWVRGRGDADLDRLWTRSVAVVGSRASTPYGEHCAAEIAAVAAERGVAVISGGAYGIDAAAHRGAIAAGGDTVAVLAGGVDRLYPRGNERLLERILDACAVVSEQPPGFAPHRQRFLSRNRLIAAASATVVVEAAWRSGALSTAAHAGHLARPVGAVPGPVTSASSAGCHRLVREGAAVLLGRAADALELAMPLGEALEAEAPEDSSGDPSRTEFASREERQAYGAIPRLGASSDAVAIAAGLTSAEVLRALGGLAARGLVIRGDGRWRRAPRTRRAPSIGHSATNRG